VAYTLVIIKPDAVRRGLIGQVVTRFEEAGFGIREMAMTRLTMDDAREFYAVHKQRPFYAELCTFMSSGPCVPCLVEGDDDVIGAVRKLMGATNPADADPGTIRRDFAEDIQHNVVHGSDGPETAGREIEFFARRLGWSPRVGARS
jgi:nucleoside-diphosphate kinase